ncbi:hypothetical protein EYZ11_001342 [Aspergillus tanneri]|uniref:Uncharacterized protein n=1 Tax=Aspergillus tanneri TaxID=1220188 RepID=A0A4S3JUV2_9EURO|nr:hypothetical protein EYZ11_001342 [Aspergillus tanneri]
MLPDEVGVVWDLEGVCAVHRHGFVIALRQEKRMILAIFMLPTAGINA